MSSFASLPTAPEPRRRLVDDRPPSWSQPPEDVLPVAVPLNLLLAHTEHVAVAITNALVYPTGLALGLRVLRREPPVDRGCLPLPFLGQSAPGAPGGRGGRFVVGFSDGRRAVLGKRFTRATADPATEARLTHIGGGGSTRRWTGRLYLWPLPPPGPMTVTFAWDEEGIGERRTAIDPSPLLAATTRTVALWPPVTPAP